MAGGSRLNGQSVEIPAVADGEEHRLWIQCDIVDSEWCLIVRLDGDKHVSGNSCYYVDDG